jgi:UPF0271 protein
MNTSIDLNCDLGEGFGQHTSGQDGELMKFITSANIACGFHAGDFSVMHHTVSLALQHGVAVGAHPSLPDLQGFGRRTMSVTPREVYEMVLYQVGALQAFAIARRGTLHHVKPHGALYNMAAKDRKLADAIVLAIADIDPSLFLYGLANSELILAARAKGIPYAEEVFADRTYQPDGSLTPRTEAGALIDSIDGAVNQVIQMIETQSVTATNGARVALTPGTVCLHGDGTHAVIFAQSIHHQLKTYGIRLIAPSFS